MQPQIEHNIKALELSELKARLMEVAGDCPEEDVINLDNAFKFSEYLHAEDDYKQQKYIYHLARVSTRLALYMEINDPDVLSAALLHDSVEDHADEILRLVRSYTDEKIAAMTKSELQIKALAALSEHFNDRIATIVEAITNPPDLFHVTGYNEKLYAYAKKVQSAIETTEGWLVKFSDWNDNGLGVIYDKEGQGDKHDHFRRKYGLVLPIFEDRFYQDDIQELLSPSAKDHVIRRFDRGRERLEVPTNTI